MTNPPSLSHYLLMTWTALLFALSLQTGSLSAHIMPQTAVMLDFHADGVAAELIMPLQDLGFAVKEPLVDEQDQAVQKYGPALNAYILVRVHPVAPDGRPWSVESRGLFVKPGEQVPDLTVHLWMRPPPGAPLRRFALHYDVIVREVASHKAFVYVRNDPDALRFRPLDEVPPYAEAIGLVRYLVYTVPIDRTRDNFLRAFGVLLPVPGVDGLSSRAPAGATDSPDRATTRRLDNSPNRT